MPKLFFAETTPCRWCGISTSNLQTEECDSCWELNSRINENPELTKRILASLENKKAVIIKDKAITTGKCTTYWILTDKGSLGAFSSYKEAKIYLDELKKE